jgi:magnesium chelatase family protein
LIDMLARTLGYGLSGVNGFAVKVEVYAANGMPALDIIGLPDASVKESRDRVSAAIRNAGFSMPISRLTVNLAPADTKK